MLCCLHVETYGAVSRLEKQEYVLKQIRLNLKRKDCVRAMIQSRKMTGLLKSMQTAAAVKSASARMLKSLLYAVPPIQARQLFSRAITLNVLLMGETILFWIFLLFSVWSFCLMASKLHSTLLQSSRKHSPVLLKTYATHFSAFLKNVLPFPFQTISGAPVNQQK
jgi:hypothetical protein